MALGLRLGLSVSAALMLAACAPQQQAPTATTPVPASDPYAFTHITQTTCPQTAASFPDWVQHYEAFAYHGGQSKDLIVQAFQPVKENPSISAKQAKQPEFVTPVWTYLDKAVSQDRITRGQQAYMLNRTVVDQTAQQYGVEPGVLMGIWGIETDFGRSFGDVNVFEALSNLGYGAKRTDFACTELTAALTIADRYHIPTSKMIGSWAGAMGHSQFLPSNYLSLAVDADHSGTPDLWTSMPDVFASTANHLVKNGGWLPSTPWGFEVKLPVGFPYQQAELDIEQPVATWQQLGVKRIDGTPLPAYPGPTSILVLAGWKGPAFLITKNFKSILRYNNSTSYALSVSELGQRILGGPGIVAAWPTNEPPLALADRQELQTRLVARGYDIGTVDGILGLKTRKAVRQFQATIGWPQDGFPNKAVLDALRAQPGGLSVTVAATVERISDQVGHQLPKLAVVLSAGLQAVDGDVEAPAIFSYADLPGFPTSAVPSHLGRLLIGKLAGHTVALLESHDDYYASGAIDAMRAPLAVAAGLGCDKVLITTAAHSLRADLGPGQLVLVTGHLVLGDPATLSAALGSLYPVDWRAAYDGVLNERLRLSAARIETPLAGGRFAWQAPGLADNPPLDTAREQGADMIGRTLIAEAVIARALGLRVAALANILDWAPGASPQGVSPDLARQRADFSAIHLRRLLADYLEHGGAD